MIFEADQSFTLPYPGSDEQALAFLRDPGRSLRRVSFLRGLTFDGRVVRAELTVNVPMLGTVPLPFESELVPTETGAVLVPRPLSGRGWAEVGGEGAARTGTLHYDLAFRAHIEVPVAQKWGGAAFEKMFHATARKTLERVAHEFPAGVQAAMP